MQVDGSPFLADAQANLFCQLDQATRYHTHTIFVGRVYSITVQQPVDPLVYQDGTYAVAKPIDDGGPKAAADRIEQLESALRQIAAGYGHPSDVQGAAYFLRWTARRALESNHG